MASEIPVVKLTYSLIATKVCIQGGRRASRSPRHRNRRSSALTDANYLWSWIVYIRWVLGLYFSHRNPAAEATLSVIREVISATILIWDMALTMDEEVCPSVIVPSGHSDYL
jgi:hypothetical protein